MVLASSEGGIQIAEVRKHWCNGSTRGEENWLVELVQQV